jgi:hypothetical protein
MGLTESDTGCFLFFSSGCRDRWIEIWLPTVGSNVYGVGMQEYTIQRSNRRCHVSDREFVPAESYYSALIAQGSSLLRQDFSREVWEQNRPQGVVGWWVSIVPQKRSGRPKPAPVHVLLAALEVLLEDPLKGELAYLLTLLLIRRRVLTEPIGLQLNSEEEPMDSSLLHLTHAGSNREFVVPICQPEVQRMESLQQELDQLLFSEA